MRNHINLIEGMGHIPSDLLNKAVDELTLCYDASNMAYMGFAYDYRDHMGLDTDDEDELDAGEPSVKEFYKEWITQRVHQQFRELSSLVHGGSVVAYRVITAPKDFKPDANWHPGIYWSWDKQNAEAHWGEFTSGYIEFMITARIPESSIDWLKTLVMKASPEFEEEDELRLNAEDAPVEVLSVKPRKG